MFNFLYCTLSKFFHFGNAYSIDFKHTYIYMSTYMYMCVCVCVCVCVRVCVCVCVTLYIRSIPCTPTSVYVQECLERESPSVTT